jgi:hypothetical protein
MSFIYDNDKLLADLIKSAVDHEMKFNKKGQLAADPTVNVEFRNYLTLTQKLAEQLRDKYFPKASDSAVISTGTGKDAPMGVQDLASLGNFLDFIVNNQITVDGKRVALGANEPNPDPRQYLPVTAEQIKFMMETENQQGERGQFQADYYVSKDLLVKYVISMLRDTSKQDERSQQFIKAMLGARLQDINKVFRTNLTTDYKEPEKPIDNSKEVDRFPKVIENFKNYAQAGEVPLLYGDINSLETLNTWLGKNQIGHKTEDQKTVTIKDQDFDLCGIINYMYGRATLLYQRRTAESGPIMKAYIGKMTEIAKQAGCELSQPGKGQPGKEQPGQGGQGQINPQALIELSALRPFNADVINFREIQLFTHKYAQLAPRLASMSQQIDTSINEAKQNMNVQNDQIMIGMLVDSNDLNPLKALTRMPVPFMDRLYTIIYTAGTMYQDFYNAARYQSESHNGRIPDDVVNQIAQQVAEGGPWSTNMADINQMREDLQDEIRSRGR